MIIKLYYVEEVEQYTKKVMAQSINQKFSLKEYLQLYFLLKSKNQS
jgi:hypothetical protein